MATVVLQNVSFSSKQLNGHGNQIALHTVLLLTQGKLLYCHPPPHIEAEDFQPQHSKFQRNDLDSCDPSSTSNTGKIKRIENTVDKNFFHAVNKQLLNCISHYILLGWLKDSG